MAQLLKDLHRFFIEEPPADQVTLADVLQLTGERTFGFLLVLLALPSALPIPAAGYSVPFGMRFSKPRLTIVCTSRVGRAVIGFA